MAPFSRLVVFQSTGSSKTYFADISQDTPGLPAPGELIKAYSSLDNLLSGKNAVNVNLDKMLPPLPDPSLPIYCVGLNYRSHAKEAKLSVPTNPPLWTKPAACLASPSDDIHMNRHCASSFPDYEGELVFVTSRECKDVGLEEAHSYILGYTAGNDLSCRMFQLPEQSGGQFFYAKAFDKFAPIGPSLVSPEVWDSGKGATLTVRVNGQARQTAQLEQDVIFSPAKVLSWMSQGTTIPAYTAVMTGTPAGVGAFMSPKTFLANGDEVEVEITRIGLLKNKILFPEGKSNLL